MDDRDEQFLLELHEALDKRAIEIDDPAYLPLHEQPGDVSGPDAVKLLARTLTRTAPGGSFFLTGLRGSGKTVQLKRLKRQLRERGYGVVMFSAEDYLNMHEALDVVDVLFFLVGAISDQAVAEGLLKPGDAADSPGWSRLREWLHDLPGRVQVSGGEVRVEVGLPGAVTASASLKAELRRDTSFVAQLRAFLRGRLAELVAAANRILAEMLEDMRERWTDGEWKGLVVIVDSLDHNRAVDSEKFQQVRRALVNLFDKDYQNIRLAGCHTVFTLPLHVQVPGGAMRRITNVKVRDRDGAVDENGVALMRALLRLRVPGGDLARFLPSEESERGLVLASGGHLRLLLMLAMEVEIQAEKLPVDEATVRSAIDQVRNGMLPLADDERALLRRVAADKEVPLTTQERWDVASRLLDQHFVLGYQNGDTWYDVHPLLAGEIG